MGVQIYNATVLVENVTTSNHQRCTGNDYSDCYMTYYYYIITIRHVYSNENRGFSTVVPRILF